MTSPRTIFTLALLGTLLLGSGASSWAASTGAAGADQFVRNFDDVPLTDTAQQRFDLRSLAGKVVLYNFIYTGCTTVCPVQTQALVQVMAGLPKAVRQQIRLVSVSIDPLGDTPQGLLAYARQQGADRPGWIFLSGSVEGIDKLSARLRLRPAPRQAQGLAAGQTGPAAHTTALWLTDADGRLRMRYDGRHPDVPRLIHELSTLARQPSQTSAARTPS